METDPRCEGVPVLRTRPSWYAMTATKVEALRPQGRVYVPQPDRMGLLQRRSMSRGVSPGR